MPYYILHVILTIMRDARANLHYACDCQEIWWGSVTVYEREEKGGDSSSLKGSLDGAIKI